jgi:hypothetical protein
MARAGKPPPCRSTPRITARARQRLSIAKPAASTCSTDDVQQFFRQCAEEDARRANQCHELFGKLTGANGS